MFCATKQSSLKETGDEARETDAESKPCFSVLRRKYLRLQAERYHGYVEGTYNC